MDRTGDSSQSSTSESTSGGNSNQQTGGSLMERTGGERSNTRSPEEEKRHQENLAKFNKDYPPSQRKKNQNQEEDDSTGYDPRDFRDPRNPRSPYHPEVQADPMSPYNANNPDSIFHKDNPNNPFRTRLDSARGVIGTVGSSVGGSALENAPSAISSAMDKVKARRACNSKKCAEDTLYAQNCLAKFPGTSEAMTCKSIAGTQELGESGEGDDGYGEGGDGYGEGGDGYGEGDDGYGEGDDGYSKGTEERIDWSQETESEGVDETDGETDESEGIDETDGETGESEGIDETDGETGESEGIEEETNESEIKSAEKRMTEGKKEPGRIDEGPDDGVHEMGAKAPREASETEWQDPAGSSSVAKTEGIDGSSQTDSSFSAQGVNEGQTLDSGTGHYPITNTLNPTAHAATDLSNPGAQKALADQSKGVGTPWVLCDSGKWQFNRGVTPWRIIETPQLHHCRPH